MEAIEARHGEPDAGIWELDDRRWAHSRLICAAGLRAAVAAAEAGRTGGAPGTRLADRLVTSVDRDCLHPDGRWQRSPDDPSVDAALLLPGVRGAVPADDPRQVATMRGGRSRTSPTTATSTGSARTRPPTARGRGGVRAVRVPPLAGHPQPGRRRPDAVRWFERNRGRLGPPGLFAEEYDVVQRQLRGNLPQAFVHALLLETAQRLGEAGVSSTGFAARAR